MTKDREEAASPSDPLLPTHPPGTRPLLSLADAQQLQCFLLGLEIRPVYRDPQTGDLLPKVLRSMQRSVGRALRKAVFDFTLNHTSLRPQHYYSLGRRKLQKLVWEVDHELAEVAAAFDVLLHATPVNRAGRVGAIFRKTTSRACPSISIGPCRRNHWPSSDG